MQRFPQYRDARPLPGARPVPLPAAVSSDATEDTTDAPRPSNPTLDMMDDALARDLAPKQPSAPSPPPEVPVTAASTKPSLTGDFAARTAARTAARLDQLERLLRTQEAELRKRENEVERLQDENRSLKRENREMHRFLADYGLSWVGGSSSASTPRGSASAASSATPTPPATAGASTGAPAAPRSRPARQGSGAVALASEEPGICSGAASMAIAAGTSGVGAAAGAISAVSTDKTCATAMPSSTRSARKGCVPPEMERVRRAVAELNAMAEGGGEVVKRRDGSHGFATPSLTLTFWSNGLQLDEGALRAYDAPDAVAFLRDLLDGFFPYELKHAFPEGVIFDLADHTTRSFGSPVGADHQWGCGRRLDSRGDSRTSQMAPAPSGATLGARPTPTLLVPSHTSSSLSTLPASLLHLDTPGTSSDVTVTTRAERPESVLGGAGAWLPTASVVEAEAAATATKQGGGDGCRLQIKGVGGGVACVLDFPPSAQLSAVHAALAARAVVPMGVTYELRTAFPAKPLNDQRATLAALGLVPSATLLVRILGNSKGGGKTTAG